MVVETVEITVASLNYEGESQKISRILREIEAMVHSKDEFVVGDPDFTMGWYFFTVSVRGNLIVKIVNLLSNEFLMVKGNTFENKFVNWLAARLKQAGSDNVHLNLKSELETSKYGLF